MQVFYAPDLKGNVYILDEKESIHTVRVLRMGQGTEIKLIDGKGSLYEGVISDADQHGCRIRITNVLKGFEQRNYNLHIAISPLKNPERLEWFIEKSVEIGVDQITPLLCHNTEKQSVRADRLNNIIISAMKQSLKAKLTVLNESSKFESFIRQPHNGKLMIATCSEQEERRGIGEIYSRGNNTVILIGPEGDFTGEEIEIAVAHGYAPVHLGVSRLRTETAGVAACHSIYFINQ